MEVVIRELFSQCRDASGIRLLDRVRVHADQPGHTAIHGIARDRQGVQPESFAERWVLVERINAAGQDRIGLWLVGGLYADGRDADDDFEGLFTESQGKSLLVALAFLRTLYPAARICGHRDLSPDTNQDGRVQKSEWLKSCPGFDLLSWLGRHPLGIR